MHPRTADIHQGHDPGRHDRGSSEDDRLPFLAACVPSVDIIDLDYPQWHTAGDSLDAVSVRSLQVVGDALPRCLKPNRVYPGLLRRSKRSSSN
jgi:hypothetical protein